MGTPDLDEQITFVCGSILKESINTKQDRRGVVLVKYNDLSKNNLKGYIPYRLPPNAAHMWHLKTITVYGHFGKDDPDFTCPSLTNTRSPLPWLLTSPLAVVPVIDYQPVTWGPHEMCSLTEFVTVGVSPSSSTRPGQGEDRRLPLSFECVAARTCKDYILQQGVAIPDSEAIPGNIMSPDMSPTSATADTPINDGP
ncbi:hypothetical protein Sjap_011772 [Stephania japonica]|uniref:Uncharacterized protein n=1 Tax=Stephania japonica TaxID=461633 RepID=A0AAP0JCZ8_9MAGN